MEGIASLYLARCLPALSQFAPNVKIELVSIPQTVDLSRKEADIFLSFFNPKSRGLKSALFGRVFIVSVLLARLCAPTRPAAGTARICRTMSFVGYIDDLLAIHAVRWLDEVIAKPTMSFHSNSIIAQCNAAVSGLGIVLLPTFVAAGVAGLQRILPDISGSSRDMGFNPDRAKPSREK